MDFGATIFFTDYSITPGDLARALEQRGFESLWAPEHSHIPVKHTPYPGGGDIPKHYYDTMDPFVTLTAAAVASTRLKLGTGVCLIVQRDPIQTAKLIASIDQMSGGRFLFGVGNGWNAEEIENHGTVFQTRHKLARERIEAMKEIWTRSEAEYQGELVKFPPIMAWPKPVQKPHPPVIVGGAWPYGARRAVRYGNGWIPLAGRPQYEDVTVFFPEFRRMAEQAKRDPKELPISIFGAPEDPVALARYQEAGVVRVVAVLPSAKADVVLPILDRWATLRQTFQA